MKRSAPVMKRIAPLSALFTAAILAAPAVLAAPPATDEEARVEQPENYCIGGIEDRKIIVDESRITNPFKQTTRLGCEVDGGDPRTMPELPTPSAELQLLV